MVSTLDEVCAHVAGQASGALDARIDLLVELASQNSGSDNTSGVAAVQERLGEEFAELGAETELVALPGRTVIDDAGRFEERPVGPLLRARRRPSAAHKILLAGHADTVFGSDHSFQTVSQASDRLHGPGVADLKGGLCVLLDALAALDRLPWGESIGWEVVVVPDEEVGSAASAPTLAEAAVGADVGIVVEPSLPSGDLVSRRKGSATFTFVVRGLAAHAGRAPEDGRNAVRAAAELVLGLSELDGARPGLTVNVGRIVGGGPLNIVPDLATVAVNVRLAEPADGPWLVERIEDIRSTVERADGISCECHGAVTRQPKPIDAGMASLMASVDACAGRLGLGLGWHATGGCCDGNDLAAAGLPTVDTMGVHGGGIHSDAEWMRCSSIGERSELLSVLIGGLATGAVPWPQDAQAHAGMVS